MTTQTTAKRTEGELNIDGVSRSPGRLQVDLLIEGNDGQDWVTLTGSNAEANAEYIRKAWNMHERLVESFDGMLAIVERDANTSEHSAVIQKAQELSREIGLPESFLSKAQQ